METDCFDMLGIQPTTNKDLINTAYQGQLKSGLYTTEIDLFNLKVAHQNCLMHAFNKTESNTEETTLFDGEELKSTTEIIKSSEIKDEKPPVENPN